MSALAGGTMFYRWLRLAEDDRRRLWLLYGWYSGLMVCGSCVGVVTWTFRMMSLMNLFRGNSSRDGAEMSSFFALQLSWRAAFVVSYAIEFLLLSAARLMVLDRMSEFAARHGEERLRKWWNVGGRIVMAVAVLGNAVGLAANIAAAVHYQKASESASALSAALVARNIVDARRYQLSLFSEYEHANSIAAVQMFCEVAVLLLIAASFILVGVLCTRRINSALLGVDNAHAAADAGRALRRQIVGTTCFVFFAFLLRTSVSIMLAVALQFQNSANRCPGVTSPCDATCYNEFAHITVWNNHTPGFQTTVVLISSPLSLLVALWGMTSKLTLQLMKSSQQRGIALS